MNKIKILPEQEAQKIAAGEVVERPASIVKEIIENSLDANATQISLYLKNAGEDLIRIVDNGSGMSSVDAKLCFFPHATSKIERLDDLERLQSFGFRGEALASISAVSKIILLSKEQSDQNNLGTKLELIAGKFLTEEQVVCPIGTDLQIRELFYNTPVRKKFLKEEETEWNQILNIFQAFCLSHLNIHFKLYRDDKLILNLPSVQKVKDRASQIWGHNFAQNLLNIDAQNQTDKQQFNISGYISNHTFWRYGRQYIFFFVNRRSVKNKELSQALLKGYLNVLPPARFPAAFVFIELESHLVDVNVHPRKEEVKFVKPVSIKNYVQKLVTQSLENNLTQKLQPSTMHNPAISTFRTSENFIKNSNDLFFPKNDFYSTPSKIYYSQNIEKAPAPPTQSTEEIETKQEIFQHQKIEPTKTEFKIIGQFLKTYILLENEDGLVIIDQHAAHERILYEKFLQNFEKKDGIKLLFPEILNLSSRQIELLSKEKDFFYNQGIELEQIGQNQIAIKTSPPQIQNALLKDLVLEALNFIEENEYLEEELFRKKLNEHIHSQLACKTAVKAGDSLSEEMMKNILFELQKTRNRFICVHGRPTIWTISKEEIEKNFRRK